MVYGMTSRIKLLGNAYIGEDIKRPDKLINKLNRGKILKSFYIVCFINGSDKLEILNSRLFLLKYYKTVTVEIASLVKDEDDAFEYIRCLTEISYSFYDDFLPRQVLFNISSEEVSKRFYIDEQE